MTRGQFLVLIVPLLAVLLGFGIIVAIDGYGGIGVPPWDADFSAHVRRAMADEFVWGVGDGDDDRRIWEANFNALNAWVKTFDPYGQIVPPWEVEASRERSSGQYVGIGIRIENPAAEGPVEGVTITGVKPGGPAADAGVAVGDVIVAVDGTPVATIFEATDDRALELAIRGPAGEAVGLRLRAADGAGERDVEVVRGRIDSGSVFGARLVEPDRTIGYVHIAAFQASTASDLRHDVERLADEGMRALVLDLRQNGGGLMDQAIGVADVFLPGGVIVRQRGRRDEFTETYEARKEGTVSADLAVAILVDAHSASASEILASALQDHRRAVLVGTRTYGKFLVQVVEEVPTKVGKALFKRTTSIYETPHGHNYARTAVDDPLAGLVPDLYIPTGEAEQRQLAQYFVQLSYAEWDPDREPSGPDFDDRQLAGALAVLRGRPYYPRIRPAE